MFQRSIILFIISDLIQPTARPIAPGAPNPFSSSAIQPITLVTSPTPFTNLGIQPPTQVPNLPPVQSFQPATVAKPAPSTPQPAAVGPAYLLIEGWKDCLDQSLNVNQTSVLCLPVAKPAKCNQKSWIAIGQNFKGEKCPVKPREPLISKAENKTRLNIVLDYNYL